MIKKKKKKKKKTGATFIFNCDLGKLLKKKKKILSSMFCPANVMINKITS